MTWQALLYAFDADGIPHQCAAIDAAWLEWLEQGLHESACSLAIVFKDGELHSTWTPSAPTLPPTPK